MSLIHNQDDERRALFKAITLDDRKHVTHWPVTKAEAVARRDAGDRGVLGAVSVRTGQARKVL